MCSAAFSRYPRRDHAAGGSEDRLGLSAYGFPRHVEITVALRTWHEEETGQVCGVTRQDIDLARSISAILPALQESSK